MIYSDHGLPFPNSSQIFPMSLSTQFLTLSVSLFRKQTGIYICKSQCSSLFLNIFPSLLPPGSSGHKEGIRLLAPSATITLSRHRITSPFMNVTPGPRSLGDTEGPPWAVVLRAQNVFPPVFPAPNSLRPGLQAISNQGFGRTKSHNQETQPCPRCLLCICFSV